MDVSFGGLPIITDKTLPNDRVVFVDDMHRQWTVWLQKENETEDEKTAREIADRLLGRTFGALTMEILQRAVDNLAKDIDKRVFEHVVASPEIRREYMKLLDADQRYGIADLMDDGTHRTTYMGIDRGTDASGT